MVPLTLPQPSLIYFPSFLSSHLCPLISVPLSLYPYPYPRIPIPSHPSNISPNNTLIHPPFHISALSLFLYSRPLPISPFTSIHAHCTSPFSSSSLLYCLSNVIPLSISLASSLCTLIPLSTRFLSHTSALSFSSPTHQSSHSPVTVHMSLLSSISLSSSIFHYLFLITVSNHPCLFIPLLFLSLISLPSSHTYCTPVIYLASLIFPNLSTPIPHP